jgi:hypothetical protein
MRNALYVSVRWLRRLLKSLEIRLEPERPKVPYDPDWEAKASAALFAWRDRT